MAPQFLDLGVIVGAQHDRVDHPAEHARGVGDGLAPAELHRAGIEHDRRSAELAHRHVERHARAGRTFLEHHRQHAPIERRIVIGATARQPRARLLAGARIGQDRGEPLRSCIGQADEMPRRHAG